MTVQENHALSAYDMRELRGLGWQDHGPTLRNSTLGELDDLYWRPSEVIVWIITRDEQAMQGFNGYTAKLTQRLVSTDDSRLNHGDIERSLLFGELNRDTAGHHRDCPRTIFDGPCDCESRGRLRYCRCDPTMSTVGRCTCVNDALKMLFRAVEDGMPLFGRRDEDDEFTLVASTARPKVQLIYGEHGLQLLPNFREVVLARGHVRERWPAETPRSSAPLAPSASDAQLAPFVTTPGYEQALTVFAERLLHGQTKQIRLDEVAMIEQRPGNELDRDSITKAIRQFYRLVAWEDNKPSNAKSVVEQIEAYLAGRRLTRINAAKKRSGKAG